MGWPRRCRSLLLTAALALLAAVMATGTHASLRSDRQAVVDAGGWVLSHAPAPHDALFARLAFFPGSSGAGAAADRLFVERDSYIVAFGEFYQPSG